MAQIFTLGEWHEKIGDVLWWKFPITEAPYVGTPLDLPVKYRLWGNAAILAEWDQGGWPGYHTHFTLLEVPPELPPPLRPEQQREGEKT